jgi:hypothetical protein
MWLVWAEAKTQACRKGNEQQIIYSAETWENQPAFLNTIVNCLPTAIQ